MVEGLLTSFGSLYWHRKPESIPTPVSHGEFVRLYPDIKRYNSETGPQVLERHPERWVSYFQLDLEPHLKTLHRPSLWMLPEDGLERGFSFSGMFPVPIPLEDLGIPLEIRAALVRLVRNKKEEGVDVTVVCSWIVPEKMMVSVSYGLFSQIDPESVRRDLAAALST